jgi:hypothetical protein
MSVEDSALERELDLLMAKAGAEVPPERKPGILAGYRELKGLTLLLRGKRTAADEPSNIYSLKSFADQRR